MSTKLKMVLCLVITVCTAQLTGCGYPSGQHESFYDSLVSEDGNYCFRELPNGLAWEEVKQLEELQREDITPSADASYVTVGSPVSFEDLDVPFQRGYLLDSELKLRGGRYIFVAQSQEELELACEKISDFAKERLNPEPRSGSAEQIALLPTVEELRGDLNKKTRWRDKSQNGAELTVDVDTLRANGIRVIITVTYPSTEAS